MSVRGVVCSPDGTVLVVRRASDGVWELPGGRIRDGENVRDCLRRELAEETGLDPAVGQPVHAVAWENDAGDGRFAVCYRCRGAGEVTVSDEHVAAAWVDPEAATDRLDDPQTTAVRRALADPGDRAD